MTFVLTGDNREWITLAAFRFASPMIRIVVRAMACHKGQMC